MEQAPVEKSQKKCCIVGKFEAFHKGHQKLIDTAKKVCNEVEIISISGLRKIKIFSDEEKLLLAKRFNVSLKSIPFLEIKNLSPEEFFKKLKNLGCQSVVVGTDWRFGKDRTGNVRTATELGNKHNIQVICVEPVKENGKKIGTEEILTLLKEARVKEANELLGFNYFCLGKVIRGNQLGKRLGFPTLNVLCNKQLILPYGVYEVKIQINGKTLKGIANYGIKPTIGGEKPIVEVHIPGEELPELYGKPLIVEFIRFIRKEKKFSSLEELKNQIKFDVEKLKSSWR